MYKNKNNFKKLKIEEKKNFKLLSKLQKSNSFRSGVGPNH